MKALFFRFTTVLLFSLFFFAAYSSGRGGDSVLLVVHDREISKEEFLYHYYKNYQALNRQNLEEYLELFINFQLKIAQAREEGMDRSIGFINELTEYRLQLAAPYLTDKVKEQEFVQEASERFTSEIKANHILFKLDPGALPEDTLKSYTEAIQIRHRILEGESFEQLALAISGDPVVVREGGKPGYFTAFETAYPFETAVYKLSPGEISMPVRTNFGYHLIQLADRRKATKEKPSEDQIRKLIYEAKDERTQLIEDAFVEDLKTYWKFCEYPEALEIIYKLADEKVYKGDWNPPSHRSYEEILFMMDGKGISQESFISFMSDQETEYRNLTLREYISSLYRKFVAYRLISYENFKLGEKYPEFRLQLQEYKDAMLLLAITQNRVWSKVESDNQDALMKAWEDELHSTYQVQLNEEVWSSLPIR
jgi:hypothetical protein